MNTACKEGLEDELGTFSNFFFFFFDYPVVTIHLFALLIPL